MGHKKLSIKTSKKGKLKIHKKDEEVEEVEEGEEVEEDEGEEYTYSDIMELDEDELEELIEEEELDVDSDDYDGLDELREAVAEELELEEDEEDEPEPEPKKKTGKAGKQGKSGTGKVIKSQKGKPDEVEEEEIVVESDCSNMANVGFSINRTFNLGEYESVKIGISINVPSELDVDEVDANYEFVQEWVEQKMSDAIEKYGLDDGSGEDED